MMSVNKLWEGHQVNFELKDGQRATASVSVYSKVGPLLYLDFRVGSLYAYPTVQELRDLAALFTAAADAAETINDQPKVDITEEALT